MTALITTLIDRVDNFEAVRDNLAAILLVEQQAQRALATAAGKNPELWRLRIFSERSNPWEVFQDPDASDYDAAPLINVSFDSDTFDLGTGNVVERQKATASFNVDCYAQVCSADKTVGHVLGDEEASREAQRAARLARSILMAGAYTYLGMRGVVWRRWLQSRTVFRPQSGDQSIQHVVAVRLVFQVEFNEFSPQVEGQILELVSTTVTRATTGELLLASVDTVPGV